MVTEVVVPMLGITVERGKIVEWLKKEGDPVEKGEIIFIVETEKVTTEVESPASGILAKIMVPAGVEVPVLTPVAVITEPGEEVPARYVAPPVDVPPAGIEAPIGDEQIAAAASLHVTSTPPEGPIKAVPAARKLARDKGLNLETLAGTGPEGVILLRDVEATVEAGLEPSARVSTLARRFAEKEAMPLVGVAGTGIRGKIVRADVERAVEEAAAPRLGKVIPMDSMRQVIARRMSESAVNAPHIHFFTDVWMDPVLNLRQDILPDFERKYGLRFSVNDLLVKAVALNILDFPLLNASVKGQKIHIMPDVNIGLAVALDSGLIVPAIAHADEIGLAEIVRERTDLVQRARIGKLSMDEIERGTFTVSSLAQYDITCFTAILNPPQSGILTVGKAREELVLVDGAVRGRKVVALGLSVDHRIIDGAVAADFLQNLKRKLERPAFTFLNL